MRLISGMVSAWVGTAASTGGSTGPGPADTAPSPDSSPATSTPRTADARTVDAPTTGPPAGQAHHPPPRQPHPPAQHHPPPPQPHPPAQHHPPPRQPHPRRHPRTTARIGPWLRACHPLPTLAVTAVTAGLAASHGHSATGTATLTAAVCAGQLSVGWLNDLVDTERDTEARRPGKPIAAGQLNPHAVRRAVAVSALTAALLSLYGGWLAAATHLLALCSAWGYNLRLKTTRWSAATYAVSFGLLPAFIVLALPGTPWPPLWLPLTGALLGCAAHFLNVLPDLADDAATGVRGLPQRLGAPTSTACAAALALGACGVLVLGPPDAPAVLLPLAAVTLGAGTLHGRRAGSRAAFHAVLLVALLNVALLLTAN